MSWEQRHKEATAVADAASAAHPQCRAVYVSAIAAAEVQRARRVDEIRVRHSAFIVAAKNAYELVLESTPDDDLRNAANAAHSKAVADADRARDEEIAAATAEELAARSAAERAYRNSPGWMGEVG